MSTRSVITVKDEYDSFSIYRHCDGYPKGQHGVMQTLSQAIPFAWPLPRFEAADFAAAIVRAWKEKGGGNIYFTEGPEKHGDLEFAYVVTCKDRALHVQACSIQNSWGSPNKQTMHTLYDGPLSEYKDQEEGS